MKFLAHHPLLVLFLFLWLGKTEAKFPGSLKDLEYDIFPRRTQEEAAVLEWGHSAIISALDASVAHFGPQTSQAALLEVETHPVLANPLNGVFNKTNNVTSDMSNGDKKIHPLYNEDEVHGNMVVMTNTGDLSGVQMAKIAKASGAAALLIVNVDEDRPDDIYRLSADEDGADKIDIPVVMISLNSANVLTTATVQKGMAPDEIVNNGMPERVRLYSGGDRPFFEDIEPSDPTLYLIHNLLTERECDALVKKAESKIEPVTKDDILQLSVDVEKYFNVQRVMLWQGLLHTPAWKQVDERIEQVTGFPSVHYSDFVVDRLDSGSYWEPHYDTSPNQIPMATITVFLTSGGGQLIYPAGKNNPIKVLPQKGLAVVHHNLNERHELDRFSRHAMLPPENGPVYVARKYIFATQVSFARRVAIPLFAFPFGGRLPRFIVLAHDALIQKYGLAYGAIYFDRLCVLFPALALIGMVQVLVTAIRNWIAKNTKPTASSKELPTAKDKQTNSKKKANKQSLNTKENGKASDSKKEKDQGNKEDSKKAQDHAKDSGSKDDKTKKISDISKGKLNGKQKKSSKPAGKLE